MNFFSSSQTRLTSRVETNSKQVDLADARNTILLRSPRNPESRQETASGLGSPSPARGGAGGCQRGDPRRRGSAGSRRRAPDAGGALLVAKATARAAHRRASAATCSRSGRGGAARWRTAGRPGRAPCLSAPSAGAQRHGQAGTVRARSPRLPRPACPRGACAAAELRGAPGFLGFTRCAVVCGELLVWDATSFSAWGLQALSGASRAKVAGF